MPKVSVYTQNYQSNEQYQGFTGPNKEPEDDFSGSFLSDFYKLPSLQKSDQIDIIGELTEGSEVNMTPSKLVGVLDEFIISQKGAKMTISQAIRNKYRMRQINDKELRKAMRPSNILVSGKSGSGKTEIFR